MNNNGSVDSSEIKEENNYYPFGLKHKGFNNVITGRDHKYGFGGKEEQDELGLEWHDFHARNYDASLGRWMNIDPLADDTDNYSYSTYNYAINNPVYFNDPDGMKWAPNNSGVEEVRESLNSRRKAVGEKLLGILTDLITGKEKLSEENGLLINSYSNRIGEINKSLGYLELLGDDEDYTYSFTSGNRGSSHVKNNGTEIHIEGGDVGLKIHELAHVGFERSKGRILKFDSKSHKMINGGFNHEAMAYLSQWGYEGESNTMIKKSGKITSGNQDLVEIYGYDYVSTKLQQQAVGFARKKLAEHKTKNPSLYMHYRTRFNKAIMQNSKETTFQIANEIIINPNFTR